MNAIVQIAEAVAAQNPELTPLEGAEKIIDNLMATDNFKEFAREMNSLNKEYIARKGEIDQNYIERLLNAQYKLSGYEPDADERDGVTTISYRLWKAIQEA